MLVKMTCWRLPVVHKGLHFALLNVPGFCRSPCIVFDISSNGDALLAAIPDRTSPTRKIKKRELQKIAFLENRSFRFDVDDLTNVANLHFKGITFLKVSFNFLYICEQHSSACLSELQAIFAFQRSECDFSYFAEFAAKFMRILQVKAATCRPFDDVKSLATESGSCANPQIASGCDINEEIKLSHELSPQAKKFLGFRKSGKLHQISLVEEVKSAEAVKAPPPAPIWTIKQVHSNRYDDPEWQRF
jgi:hypothetical protein